MSTIDEYQRDQSIYLNLSRDEITSLKIIVEDMLRDPAKSGASLTADERRRIIDQFRWGQLTHERACAALDAHPTSHIGVLLRTLERLEAAQLGRKTWNNGRSS